MPQISVIVPLRDRSGTRLANCLRSLRWQDDAPELELVLADYGSVEEHARGIDELAERFGEDLLFADGLDDALIGASLRFGREPIAIYDRKKVIALFMAEHVCDCEPSCSEGEECPQAWEQAEEHFGFNVIGAWVGDKTPAYAELLTTKLDDDRAAGAARNHYLAGGSDQASSVGRLITSVCSSDSNNCR